MKRIQVGSLFDLNYGYDRIGNITVITATANSNQKQTFTYDALDRLTSAGTTLTGSGPYSQTYRYDAIGNLTYKAGATQYYSDTLHKHAVSAVITGGQTLPYLYDANGNMTQRVELSGTQRITYTQGWDAENRLKTVTNTVSGQVTQFIYDGDGQRVKKIAPNGQPTIYIGSLYEKNLSTTVTTTYYFAGSTRLAMRQGGVLSYLVGDHLGSTSLTTNASGGVVARQLYDAWGNVRYITGTLPTDISFTGQRSNSEVGLLFFKARFYSPAVGRFLSADTLVPDGKNPQQFNRYAYGLNNPVKHTDPTGHRVSNGCQTEGCATDEYWVDNYLNFVSNVIDSTDPSDHPLDQLTAHFYRQTTAGYTPEAGQMTRAGALVDASQAARAHVQARGVSAAQDLEEMQRMGVAADVGIIFGATEHMPRWNASGSGPLRAGESGRYADLSSRSVTGDELTIHHMPQKALGFTSEADGGALVMESTEHIKTRTYGWRGALTVQEDIGKSFRDILAKDIWDVRSIVGSQYNQGLLDLIDYYKTNFPTLMHK